MIEIPLKFKDFDGNTIEETWAFHLGLTDIAALEANGGFENRYRAAMKSKDGAAVLQLLQELMISSVGKRSDDRKRFLQSNDIQREFKETGAYDALFTQLALGDIPAAHFFNGVMPSDLSEKAARMQKLEGKMDVEHLDPKVAQRLEEAIFPQGAPGPARPKTYEDYTHQELLEMSTEEFTALIKPHKNNIPQSLMVVGMQRLTQS